MAQEQVNNELSMKMKFALWAVGVVFTAGMTYITISSNTTDIKENRRGIAAVKDNVIAIQRGQDRVGFAIESIKKDVAEGKLTNLQKIKEDRVFQAEQRQINQKILIELGKWEAVKDGQNP